MAVVGKATVDATGVDFLEWLGPDTSAVVFALLRDPADIARASAVSRSWRTIVLATHFRKIQCLRACADVTNFVRIEQVSASPSSSTNSDINEEVAGSSAAAAWGNHEREQRVFTHLAYAFLSRNISTCCIAGCVGASSTDNFPDESIENTLEPRDVVDLMPWYWSSGGQWDPSIPECLIYKLSSDLCLIDEIRIKPFRAFFQDGMPIYSSQSVCFRFGCPKSPLRPEDLVSDENEGKLTADNNYIWTYTSREFPMLQRNRLQSFKLPRSVLCIGGVVKVEFHGRIQKQAADDLYYICVSNVQILGTPLSSEFGAAPCENGLVLKYCPDPDQIRCSELSGSLSKWRYIEARFWQQVTGHGIQLNQELANRLLGPALQSVVEEDDDEMEDACSVL
ncbi:hypothetical protein PR202_gb25557 [Eleusine coracana subsp. coracana]|uniref:F-box protein n=1 Tax=Eleusine coracana subsp. coracana TaxID=191504 RepID=A0AAV5FQG8_ELECO|nr:hypothetical protein QOZ80_8BG0650700 [Eleusine coracana subsp. coracana]GJN36675.1 hypothetical protein PR202_gb25557 [Eleusine coracana subsp. coracana]